MSSSVGWVAAQRKPSDAGNSLGFVPQPSLPAFTHPMAGAAHRSRPMRFPMVGTSYGTTQAVVIRLTTRYSGSLRTAWPLNEVAV